MRFPFSGFGAQSKCFSRCKGFSTKVGLETNQVKVFWEGSLNGRSRKRTTLIGWGKKRQRRGWKAANDAGNWQATDFNLMHQGLFIYLSFYTCIYLLKVSSRLNRKSIRRGGRRACSSAALKRNGRGEAIRRDTVDDLWSPIVKSHKQASTTTTNVTTLRRSHSRRLCCVHREQKSQREVRWKGEFQWANIYS